MGRLIDLDKVEFLKVDGNIEFNHGVDCCINTLLKQPTIKAIPKAEVRKLLRDNADKVSDSILDIVREDYIHKTDYENRLKADMAAMLEDLDLQIDEFDSGCGWDGYIKKIDLHELIQQKINELRGKQDE